MAIIMWLASLVCCIIAWLAADACFQMGKFKFMNVFMFLAFSFLVLLVGISDLIPLR